MNIFFRNTLILISYFLFLFLTISCKDNEIEEEVIPPNYSFPHHVQYQGSYIIPSNYSQAELDSHVTQFYDLWKNEYVKNACGTNQYYIAHTDGYSINVSEGLGYGMMITAIMAGYDTDAKKYFDGMFRFFKAHPSSVNAHLMAWEQVTGCIDNPDGGNDAATDGDVDIAYALLLASKQWGDEGDINYLAEAQQLIAAIMESEIDHETWAVRLGDWPELYEPEYYYGTRTSDFIMDHFRTFQTVSMDSNWSNVVDECYSLINLMQTNYSTSTGLIPDFIYQINTSPTPVYTNYIEDPYDGTYNFNACRDPWRITTDYLTSGDARAKTAIDNIHDWLLPNTAYNPDNIAEGYYLDGTPIVNESIVSFYGAFAVSAMIGDNQEWLNSLYDKMLTDNFSDNDYYENTLKMLFMITMSENLLTY